MRVSDTMQSVTKNIGLGMNVKRVIHEKVIVPTVGKHAYGI